MINDTIHTIWPGWKVVDKIGNDSRDMLFEVIQSNDSVDTRGSVKVISIPEEEAEIHTLLTKGKSEENPVYSSFSWRIEYDSNRRLQSC